MKNNLRLLIGLICLSSAVSCKKEGCTDSKASNYDIEAKKNNGTCIFSNPGSDPRDPYLGNYLVTDTLFLFDAFSEVKTYTLQVTTGGTVSDTLYLKNLWSGGNEFIALMTGSNFSIPSQQVSGPYFAAGTGNFTSNVITYETSGDIYANKGVGSKQ